jgi:hypothetical protein
MVKSVNSLKLGKLDKSLHKLDKFTDFYLVAPKFVAIVVLTP